jgi:hypothetical protein
MTTIQESVAAFDRPLPYDFTLEELLAASLQTLGYLAQLHPGGVTAGELARNLGFGCRPLAAALERGRHPALRLRAEAVRPPLVERVKTDAADPTRSRYVLTAAGREELERS